MKYENVYKCPVNDFKKALNPYVTKGLPKDTYFHF